MVDTNTPNDGDGDNSSSESSSNQDAANQTVDQPQPSSSRYFRRPEMRTSYDHIAFVRAADRQMQAEIHRRVYSLEQSSSSSTSSSTSAITTPSPYLSQNNSSQQSPGSPESNDDFRLFLESQVPRIGFFVPRISNLQENLDTLREQGYEFIVLNVARNTLVEIIPVCDLLLSSTDWISHTAAYISVQELCVDLPKYKFLEAQFDQAQHLSMRDIIVECPENIDACTRLSRVVNARLGSGFSQSRFHMHLFLQSRRAQTHQMLNSTHEPTDVGPHDSWLYWNHIRSLIGYDRRLGVALELDGDLPDEDECKRWCGEPVSMLVIPFILFLPSSNSSLTLPTPYRNFITSLVNSNARQISIMVKGQLPPAVHQKVVHYLAEFGKNWVSNSLVDEFAVGYEDFLQIPLQPLADNLESSTYEIFEKDPIKYESYRQAMMKALARFSKQERVVVLLVGAGRGPLIRCALSASDETGRLIDLYAIEKNECAAYTLKSQDWVLPLDAPGTGPVSTVTIVNTDIRDWTSEVKADILLSELLGSFGDNELSPECLDGAWKFCKPTAFSVPESYRSYVQPIMSHRLYTETLAESTAKSSQYTDIHFVTHMKSFFPMAEVKQLFEFVHTNLSEPPTDRKNLRYEKLQFRPHTECVLHGFAGYFDTTLIDDITLSIVPDKHTQSLISWFPTWIPLATPVKVKPTDTIVLHFWRNATRHKVWYEWCIQSPVPTRIQNPNGKFYSVGLNS